MKIQILMSTYNGSRYLRTQLDSILAQDIRKNAELTLQIRDDGSADDTQKIVREYQKHAPWISFYGGENIGVQKSFLELIRKSDPEADYFAFSDQDDEWLPEKLSRAVSCLEKLRKEGGGNEGREEPNPPEDAKGEGKKEQKSGIAPGIPRLYCSDKIIVGKDLEELTVTVSRPVRKTGFGNALVQCICTGCTAVFNREAAELLRNYPPKHPEKIIMHDWWLYLTVSCFGNVYYDKRALIRYRQHGGNASGAMLNHRALLRYRLEQLRKPRGEIFRQTEEFLETYQGVPEKEKTSKVDENREMAEKLLRAEKGMQNRLQIVCDNRFFRQKCGDDLVFRGIVMAGKL